MATLGKLLENIFHFHWHFNQGTKDTTNPALQQLSGLKKSDYLWLLGLNY